MSAFGGLLLTNKGRNLRAKAETGVAIQFTRIALGDGDLGSSSIVDLNALKNEVLSLNITRLRTLSQGKAVVGTVFSNQDITTGFYFREIGLFAQDPDEGEILYCYGNAGVNAEYIPAPGGADIIEKHVDVVVIVGDTTEVSAAIDESLVFETVTGAQEKANTAETNAKAYADQQVGDLAGEGRTTETVKGNADTISLHISDNVAHVTVAERTAWDAKETPEGAQTKVDAHEAKSAPHAGHEKLANKGAANGYASLDSNAKVPLSQLPDIARQQTYVLTNATERESLTGLVAGDRAYETSTGDTYIWDGAQWLLQADADWANVNLEWANINGKPTSAVADIDDAVSKKHSHSNKAILDSTTAAFTSELKTKLDDIEAGAEVNPTAIEMLTSIKSVDGSGSGLDADLLDGQEGSYYATTIQMREAIQIDTNIILAAANWVDDTPGSGFWIYDVADAEVTSDTIIDVYIQRPSQQTAQDAGVQPFCESAAGSFRLFASNQPAGSITIDVKKTRQVVT